MRSGVKKTGDKGLKTEELIRRYFIKAGFFVVRGITLKAGNNDLTDIDLWTYERSATLARRRTVFDIKDKKAPQAAERMYFIKGLAESIGVEGAGVVTTDDRPILREIARKLKLLLVDGGDLQRLKGSSGIAAIGRISEEDLMAEIADFDKSRHSRQGRINYDGLKSLVADRFGVPCANSALEITSSFAQELIVAHPDTPGAKTLGRLTYLSAAIACAAFDYACADWALRPASERHSHLTHAIRYGDDSEGTIQQLLWAEKAAREYLPNGSGAAQTINHRFNAELAQVPAEGLADVLVQLTSTDSLFQVARALEAAAFSEILPTFDMLNSECKSAMGAILDFVGVNRAAFAQSWRYAPAPPNERPQAAMLPQTARTQPELTGLDIPTKSRKK